MQQQRNDNPDFINGSDIPGGDGGVGDEQVSAISGDQDRNKPTGVDHSTDVTADREPTDGVGGVQHSEDTSSDIARGV